MERCQESMGPSWMFIFNIIPSVPRRNTNILKRQSVMNPVVNETNSYSFINVILSIEMKLAVKNKENINIYNKETLLYIYLYNNTNWPWIGTESYWDLSNSPVKVPQLWNWPWLHFNLDWNLFGAWDLDSSLLIFMTWLTKWGSSPWVGLENCWPNAGIPPVISISAFRNGVTMFGEKTDRMRSKMFLHLQMSSMMTTRWQRKLPAHPGIITKVLILVTSHLINFSSHEMFNKFSVMMEEKSRQGMAILCLQDKDRSRYKLGLKWFRMVATEMRRKMNVTAMMKVPEIPTKVWLYCSR